MKLLKSTLMASALILGTASMSYAQDAMTDKAKDMAVDKATDMAKDKAMDMAGDKAGKMVDPAMKAGKHMMKGDSAKDAVMKAGQSEAKSMMKDKVMGEGASMATTSMDGDDMMTAGKVMMKGGSKEEAAKAVAKGKAKDAVMGKAEGMVKDHMMPSGTIKSAPAVTSTAPAIAAPAPAAPVANINCPYGTTAQANGTCMVTGDYQPRT